MSTLLAYVSYNPIVRINLWGLSISPHGIGIYIGYLAGGYVFFVPAARKKGISDDDSFWMLILGLLGAAFGARFFYVVNHFSEYPNLIDTLKVWQGGLSLLGGITGAIAFNIPLWRKRGFGFWPVMDAAVPGIAFGLIFGRIGDLVIADHLGKVTTFFLGYKCPEQAVVGQSVGSPCVPGTVVHSTALYDLISVVGLLVLLLILRRKDRFPGFLAAVFGLWYGIGRMIEDFLRVDKRILIFTGSQWTALIVALYCAYLLFIRKGSPGWGMGRMASGHLESGVEPIADIADGTGEGPGGKPIVADHDEDSATEDGPTTENGPTSDGAESPRVASIEGRSKKSKKAAEAKRDED